MSWNFDKGSEPKTRQERVAIYNLWRSTLAFNLKNMGQDDRLAFIQIYIDCGKASLETGTGYAWSHRFTLAGRSTTSTSGRTSAITNWISSTLREFGLEDT